MLAVLRLFVTVYKKIGHNAAAPIKKNFFLHLRICRHPDIEPYNQSFPDVYARHVVPDFPVDGHIFPYVLNFHSLNLAD